MGDRAQIAQYPRGLLGLLNLKSFGETPRDLDAAVGITVDGLPFYLSNILVTGVGQEVAPAIGANTLSSGSGGFLDLSAPIPDNELWWLHEYNVQVSPGAATAITMQATVRFDNARSSYAPPVVCTGAAGPPTFIVPLGKSDILLPPRTSFGFFVQAITGAPGTVQGIARISRFRA